jgi:hypothetical protein
MFISFILPYPVHTVEAYFLWVFYKQLGSFKKEDIYFVLGGDYVKDPGYFRLKDRWEFRSDARKILDFEIPAPRAVEECNKVVLDRDIFHGLEKKLGTADNVWTYLIKNRYAPLEEALTAAIETIRGTHAAEAVLTWCNYASLSFVARAMDLKIIHNESGPTRIPYYIPTAFFDFGGINGHNEAGDRFERFSHEAGRPAEIMNRRDMLSLLCNWRYADVFFKKNKRDFDIGVPLQVEDDSNILAFSGGLTNEGLMKKTARLFARDKILIRHHPLGHKRYGKKYGIVDSSGNSIDFMKRCKRIVTINSSIGFEAALLGIGAYIAGQSPFRMIARPELSTEGSHRPSRAEMKKLNFMVFGYLMPYSFLFNAEYYRWRLSSPSELEIYNFHYRYYLLIKKRQMEYLWNMFAQAEKKIREGDYPAAAADILSIESWETNLQPSADFRQLLVHDAQRDRDMLDQYRRIPALLQGLCRACEESVRKPGSADILPVLDAVKKIGGADRVCAGLIDKLERAQRKASEDFEKACARISGPVITGAMGAIDVGGILNDFARLGIPVTGCRLNVRDYDSYLAKAGYGRHPFYGTVSGEMLLQKSFEHYMSARLLDVQRDDVCLELVIDIPAADVFYERVYGCKTYVLDVNSLLSSPGNGADLGVKVPLDRISKVVMHCAFEHLESDSDTGLIKKLESVLRPGAKICIIPMYFSTHYAVCTDPCRLPESGALFDKEARVYCRKGWNNRFGRYYDTAHFVSRIKDAAGQLNYKIYHIENTADIGLDSNFAFVLTGEKLPASSAPCGEQRGAITVNG